MGTFAFVPFSEKMNTGFLPGKDSRSLLTILQLLIVGKKKEKASGDCTQKPPCSPWTQTKSGEPSKQRVCGCTKAHKMKRGKKKKWVQLSSWSASTQKTRANERRATGHNWSFPRIFSSVLELISVWFLDNSAILHRKYIAAVCFPSGDSFSSIKTGASAAEEECEWQVGRRS